MNQDRDKLARSFGTVASSYATARPGYPVDAAAWLAGGDDGFGKARSVLELGAGTGRLTEHLIGQPGLRVVPSDRAHEMLVHLRERIPHARALVAAAERIPMPSRTFDVVAVAQAFHWFGHDEALPEIARVLRPDGHLALVWNIPDESTPWVRKLQRIVPRPVSHEDDIAPLRETKYFGFVEERRFRTWETVTRTSLLELVKSRSPYAVADEASRERMLAEVGALYDDYDRGTAGLQLPYVTRCYRARVIHQDGLGRRPAPRPGRGYRRPSGPAMGRPPATPSRPTTASGDSPAGPETPGEETGIGRTAPPSVDTDPQEPPTDDDGTLLIDLR